MDSSQYWALDLSVRTANALIAQGFQNRREIEIAFAQADVKEKDWQRPGPRLGTKGIAEVRRWLGLDPPLPAASDQGCCPRCGGDTGYRTNVTLAAVRHYAWNGEVLDTEIGPAKTEGQAVCRDCERGLRLTLPHHAAR